MEAASKPSKRPGRASAEWREMLIELGTSEHVYAAMSAVLVLSNAQMFYGAMRLQTEHVALWSNPEMFDQLVRGAVQPEWSAPLDDVFIHFDFARSAAAGAPFEWTPGNGYSSGGTSLLYPFVLAIGLWLGFTGLGLMHFAATLACVSTFAFLLAARRAFKRLSPATALVAPVMVMSTGVLNWSLFSGMEVALFLAAFGGCLVLWDDALDHVADGTLTRLPLVSLGLAGAVLVMIRPEAAPLLAAFGIGLAVAIAKKRGIGRAVSSLFLVGTLGAIVVIGHMVMNHVLTGSSSAAGALAKLELHHPYMTGKEIWESWLFFISYQFFRLSDYHFSAVYGPGFLIWPLALLSLVFERTRRYGALLATCVVLWILLVALNGQVRWQNERYTMPAVGMLLLCAALGVGGALDFALEKRRKLSLRLGVAGGALTAAALFLVLQAPRFREQVWFFGRASRNILEQHVAVGRYLESERTPKPRRVLLSDAGAIPYASGLPAFDLIGLGGYAGLPIAKASRQGVGAAVELLEHVPEPSRPDVMALYPGWWGTFVLWFGHRTIDFPVRGNVICGGASKVLYEPDFSPLDHSGEPLYLGARDALVDAVDVADLISEEAHEVTYLPKKQGYVTMKLLPDPRSPRSDLWDGGRVLAQGGSYEFSLATGATRLLLRVAPATRARFRVVEVAESGQVSPVGPGVEATPSDAWQELRVGLRGSGNDGSGAQNRATPGTMTRYRLEIEEGELHVYHLFAIRSP